VQPRENEPGDNPPRADQMTAPLRTENTARPTCLTLARTGWPHEATGRTLTRRPPAPPRTPPNPSAPPATHHRTERPTATPPTPPGARRSARSLSLNRPRPRVSSFYARRPHGPRILPAPPALLPCPFDHRTITPDGSDRLRALTPRPRPRKDKRRPQHLDHHG